MAKKKKTVGSTRKKLDNPEKEVQKTSVRKDKRKSSLGKLFAKKKDDKKKITVKSKKKKAAKSQKVKEQKQIKIAETIKPEKKPEKKKISIKPEHKQKIKGGALIAIGLFAIIFIGIFLFSKIFRPQSLAELLPAQDTIAVLEINVDPNHSQTKQFQELLTNYPIYQEEGLKNLLNSLSPIDFKGNTESWIGRKIGFALVKIQDKEKENIYSSFFIETRDKNLTLEYLEAQAAQNSGDKLVSKGYNGTDLYSFNINQDYTYTFLNNYLVISENKDVLELLIDNRVNDEPRLTDDEYYRKVANNLPQDGIIFAYVNLNKIFNILAKDPLFIAQKGQEFLSLRPFLNLFTAEGISVYAKDDKFMAQSFTRIDKDLLDGESYITYSEKYRCNYAAF